MNLCDIEGASNHYCENNGIIQCGGYFRKIVSEGELWLSLAQRLGDAMDYMSVVQYIKGKWRK